MKNLLLLPALCLFLTSCDGTYTQFISNSNQEMARELRSPDSTFSLSVFYNVGLVPVKKRVIGIDSKNETSGPILLTINGQEKKDFKVQHLINNGTHRYFLSKTGIKKGDSISLTWDTEAYNFVLLDSVVPQSLQPRVYPTR